LLTPAPWVSAMMARALVAATFMKAELPRKVPSGVPIMMA